MAFSTVATWKLRKWTGPELIRRVPKIVTLYGKVMDQQLKEEIKAVQYTWPRKTKRKNGSEVGSPRDIVDEGGFLRSQNRENPSPSELRFSWNTPYANLIFNGYTTRRGLVAPPRNWILPALEKRPLDDFFREQWARLASNDL